MPFSIPMSTIVWFDRVDLDKLPISWWDAASEKATLENSIHEFVFDDSNKDGLLGENVQCLLDVMNIDIVDNYGSIFLDLKTNEVAYKIVPKIVRHDNRIALAIGTYRGGVKPHHCYFDYNAELDDYIHIDKDGNKVTMSLNCDVRHDDNGNVVGSYYTATIETEKKCFFKLVVPISFTDEFYDEEKKPSPEQIIEAYNTGKFVQFLKERKQPRNLSETADFSRMFTRLDKKDMTPSIDVAMIVKIGKPVRIKGTNENKNYDFSVLNCELVDTLSPSRLVVNMNKEVKSLIDIKHVQFASNTPLFKYAVMNSEPHGEPVLKQDVGEYALVYVYAYNGANIKYLPKSTVYGKLTVRVPLLVKEALGMDMLNEINRKIKGKSQKYLLPASLIEREEIEQNPNSHVMPSVIEPDETSWDVQTWKADEDGDKLNVIDVELGDF